MSWSLETSNRFDKEFKKLDHYTQRIIKGWIVKNIAHADNPRAYGKALTGNFAGLSRYRIGDYRLIVEIQDDRFIILALSIGHRAIYAAKCKERGNFRAVSSQSIVRESRLRFSRDGDQSAVS
ncbi:type II toxin-antitoxin system RelE/ParE family toxin [Arcanobacterium canis]|uniref:Type II toxin-antitoxin system RelE/ParE family toxin n=1 Tax=Arcanobacterium canis TaxID=999183 RepID=A0ABY8FYH2_9ACTO|nr:type II toxin-antitoxin system RelE/ParE family toxin [Arcanobacterium canis]WFM83557.1 type II toxin-antitoxin system RelE/ParE family toxin [Arcanobacterium canis]